MRNLLWVGFISALWAAGTLAAPHQETVIVDNILGPEGPLVVDGKLYFVSWTPGTLSVWDGKTSKVLNEVKGCGHNGLALTKSRTFLLACSDTHGAIIELDLSGKELRRWDKDDHGRSFDGGINDIVVAANGGAYATVFGPFEKVPTAIAGRVLYMSPGSGVWRQVADRINYANGIAVSPDQKTLYVDEMASNAVIKFEIAADGTIGAGSNFVRLDLLSPAKVQSWWAGPDSLKIDKTGNLYVAQFYNGRILKISPEGKLLHAFNVSYGNGTTNVAFDDSESQLYVSVVKTGDDLFGDAKGAIVRIPNVR
jgi:gluconolactonase